MLRSGCVSDGNSYFLDSNIWRFTLVPLSLRRMNFNENAKNEHSMKMEVEKWVTGSQCCGVDMTGHLYGVTSVCAMNPRSSQMTRLVFETLALEMVIRLV